ncbi:MAG: AMP-binding protein, partial [Solirubrobacteraceae bacterium]
GRAEGFEAWDDVVATQPNSPVSDEQGGSFMLYSSGTTGRPRGIVPYIEDRPPDAPAPFVALMTGLYGFTPASVYLSPAPLYHAAPLGWVQGTQRIGATAVIMERFDPEGFLAAIERFGVTHTQVVPTMLIRLLRLPASVRDRYDISTLQCLVHAAAPCPVAVKEQAIDWLGPIVNEFYSSSEGLGFTAIDSQDWLTHEGSVGRPLFAAIRILGPEGQELPSGTPGMIWFEEGGHFRYHNDPEKTAEAIDAKGRASVGDIGYVDDEGFLYLTDRSSNLIVCGGVNVYPQEAENLLASHPDVEDVAVFGVPDPDLGEVVKAVVQPIDPDAAGPELADRLIAHCRDHLATIKCPRSVDFDAALPRLANGKLLKREVRSRYWDGADSVVSAQVGGRTT